VILEWRRTAPRIWAWNNASRTLLVQIVFNGDGAAESWKTMTPEEMDAAGEWSLEVIHGPSLPGRWEIRRINGEPTHYPNVEEAKAATQRWHDRWSSQWRYG
jgi:hypothetical protein